MSAKDGMTSATAPTPRLPAVRDLPAKDDRSGRVTGGAAPKAYDAACKGTHFTEAVIE